MRTSAQDHVMEYHGVKTRTLWGPGWVSLPRTHQSTSDKPVAVVVVVGGEKEVLMCLHCGGCSHDCGGAEHWTPASCLNTASFSAGISSDIAVNHLQVVVKLGVLKSVWCIVQMKTQRNAFMSVVWKQN